MSIDDCHLFASFEYPPHMLEELHPKPSLAIRLGASDDETRAAPYLRAILAFLAEAPAVGWVLKGSKEALGELSDKADDDELERRFDALLAVGGQTNERVRLLADLARAIFEQNAVLLDFLRARQLPSASDPLTQFAKDAALAAYRNRVANDFIYADHRGIEGVTRQAHVASLLLDDVYVLPRLVPEREQAPVHERERELLHHLLSDRDLAHEGRAQLEEEFALLTGERWKLLAHGTAQGLPLSRALADARKLVVIGSPGVGKSILSRFLARTCALGPEEMERRLEWRDELVPVLIPLAMFAEARRTRPELGLRVFLDETMVERGGEALRSTMADALGAGRALVLLDGVDEVPESRARAGLVQAVDGFISDHELARVVVTSRPYGYVRLRGDLPHYTLPNFSTEQVTEFVYRWQTACERKQHPQSPDLDSADQEAEALLAEIRRNPRVEELATNPLMLVIVSLIRYERTRLPEERVQLYQRAVNTLMDTWNQWRSQLGRDAGGVMLPLDRLVRVWGAVAEWTRRERNTGVVHRAELKRKLVEVLRDREYADRNAEETAESYLRAAADRAGILEERGQDIFAFWHPTFEEFLAAVELSTPTSQAIRKLLPLADDPRWHEVILLAVGYIGVVQRDPETATEVVRAILEDEVPPLEPLLHRRLRLAAACIADDVGVRRSLKERVLSQLAEIALTNPSDEIEDALAKVLTALPHFAPSAEMVATLIPLASTMNTGNLDANYRVRTGVARLLSNVAAEDPVAHAACERLMGRYTSTVQFYAAVGLARAGTLNVEILRHLAMYHWNWDDQIAAELDAILASSTPEMLMQIEALVAKDEKFFPALHIFHPQSPGLLDALHRLSTSANPLVRLAAARLLHERGGDDEELQFTIRGFLSSEDLRLSVEAASLLAEWGVQEPAVWEVFFRALGSTDYLIQMKAEDSLRELGDHNAAVIELVRDLLYADDPYTQFASASLLHDWGDGDAEVNDALIGVLGFAPPLLRWRAARLLHDSGVEDPAIAKSLLSLLHQENKSIGLESARLLLELGFRNEAVRDFLSVLLSSENSYLRERSVQMLREWGNEDVAIQEAVASVLATDDPLVQAEAEGLFATWGARNPHLIEQWVRSATPEPWTVLAACQHVLNRKALTALEAKTLADVTAQRDSDTEQQRRARANLRMWLWSYLERFKQAAA